MSSGRRRLAVGNPRSGPPRPSPRTTVPRTSWGRPSRAAAPSTSPSASSARMRVDDTAASPSPVRPPPTTPKPAAAPQRLAVAAPPVAEVEALPHDDQARRQLVHEHLLHEVLGRLGGARLVEVHDQGAVDAALGQQLELLLAG